MVFTLSREFLETFDRRIDDLLAADGADFIWGARAWLEWLRTDARSRTAYEHVLKDADEARVGVGRVVGRLLPPLMRLRERLEELAGDAVVDVPTSDAADGLARERFTFRTFDKIVGQLRSEDGRLPRLAPLAVTDPLHHLREILRIKAYSDRDTVQRIRAASRAADSALDAWSVDDWTLNSHAARCHEEFGPIFMRFVASAGRAARILEDVLERSLTLALTTSESWFLQGVSYLPGADTHVGVLASALLESDQSRRLPNAGAGTIDAWARALRPLVRQCASGVRARIGERALLISAIRRFQLRSERYDVDELREFALKLERGGRRRQAEARLTQRLGRYLFDAGFETFCEVPSGKGRADLVQFDEVYVEAKQTTASEKAHVLRGYRQAMDSVRQFAVKAVVLAIYVLEGPLYESVELIPQRPGAPETHVVIVDLRDASRRGSAGSPLPVTISEQDYLCATEAAARQAHRRKRGPPQRDPKRSVR